MWISDRTIRWVFPLLLVSLGAQGVSCSSKGPRYPADHARYERVFEAVQALQRAYVNKDLSRLHDLVLPLEPMDQLEQQVQLDFETYKEISLDLSIERIVIDGEAVDVFIHWQGQWKRSEADTGTRDTGHGKLRWVGVQSILLQGVEGDLPFGIAMRQPAQAPRGNGERS